MARNALDFDIATKGLIQHQIQQCICMEPNKSIRSKREQNKPDSNSTVFKCIINGEAIP